MRPDTLKIAASDRPTSSGSSHHRMFQMTANQNQKDTCFWRSSHSCSESLSMVSNAGVLAIVDWLGAVLAGSQSLG